MAFSTSILISFIFTFFATDLSNSLALDLYDQWKGLDGNGQFRFTPPTHAILGLRQACIELEAEGGVKGRAARYYSKNPNPLLT